MRRDRATHRHVLRRLLVAAAMVLLFAVLIWWPWVVAQSRAVAVLATVLQVPVLEPIVVGVTGEPRVDEDARLADTPTSIFRPAGDGPWPAVLFLTGADESGRRQKDVVRLGEGLARAGFIVVVPDLPGMRDGRLGVGTIDAAREVVREAAALEGVRDDQVALASVSAGASLALVVAGDEDVEPVVSVVAGIAPYADVRTVFEVALTGEYRHADGRTERFESNDWMRTAMIRSLFAATDGPAASEQLEARILERERPIVAARGLATGEVEAADPYGVLALLRADEAGEFDARYEALPEQVREQLELLSPNRVVAGIGAPVELASAPKDTYFPLSESRRLAREAPDGRLTVTSTLDHAIPSASLSDLGDLAAFDAYVVRVLREAASG